MVLPRNCRLRESHIGRDGWVKYTLKKLDLVDEGNDDMPIDMHRITLHYVKVLDAIECFSGQGMLSQALRAKRLLLRQRCAHHNFYYGRQDNSSNAKSLVNSININQCCKYCD